MTHNIIIYGGSGMATEVYELSLKNGGESSIGNVVGYYTDNGPSRDFEKTTDLSFLDIKKANNEHHNLNVLICAGEPRARQKMAEFVIKLGMSLYTYIHSTAIIANSAIIGSGCVIYPFVVVSSNTRIGEAVTINSYTGIGHDVAVGNYSVISAQVDLTGHVKVGSGVFIGSGARILPGKKIGDNSKIGAGITVIRSVGNNSVIYPTANRVVK